MTLSLIGIGLTDEKDLSLRALEEAKECDKLYVELYTMKLATTISALNQMIKSPPILLTREDLEEKSYQIIDEAKRKKIGVMVGGDCLAATTHISLILEAAKNGVKTKVIHGSSIFTAIAETGLNLYKFGRTVTVPLPEKGPNDTVLRTIDENLSLGLHTLLLMDLDTTSRSFFTISQAAKGLIAAGLNSDTLAVGVARLGQENSFMRAGRISDLASIDFGEPPHSLIIPGQLHFIEAEALRDLAGCPPEALKDRAFKPQIDHLIDKYSEGCRRVLCDIKLKSLPLTVDEDKVKDVLDHVDRYLKDADYYKVDRKPTALTSVAYAEGILDALKLMGIVEFEW